MRYSFLLLVIALVALIFNSCKDKPTNPTTTYEQVTIGTQVWMTKNLDVDHYRNGDPIPEVKDSVEWSNLNTGAWCYYNNDPVLGKKYGKLYNWYAVIDPRGLASEGWHVPSDSEWMILINYLGGDSIAGGKLKTKGTIENGDGLWDCPNVRATNETWFSAIPSGMRQSNGVSCGIGYCVYFWTSTEFNTRNSWIRYIVSLLPDISNDYYHKNYGFPVRCVKD